MYEPLGVPVRSGIFLVQGISFIYHGLRHYSAVTILLTCTVLVFALSAKDLLVKLFAAPSDR